MSYAVGDLIVVFSDDWYTLRSGDDTFIITEVIEHPSRPTLAMRRLSGELHSMSWSFKHVDRRIAVGLWYHIAMR
jgi:hypothetical protein